MIRRDVTNYPVKQSEDRGVNTKEWISISKNVDALFKETQIKSNSNESTFADYSESIVSEICELLDVPCQKTEFAVKNGKDGCLCYSFLRPNIDEMTDIGTVIQGVRADFNSKTMEVQSTKEAYGVDLIVEGMYSFCKKNKKDSAAARKALIEQILVDSIIDHYDRNPSNLSMLGNSEYKVLSPKYDNGTSLSMSVPKSVLEKYLANPGDYREKHSALRKDVYSKIGYLGRKYIPYEDLETYIFNYYYDDTKDIIDRMKICLTEEAIDKILSNNKYSDLSETHKEIVKIKVLSNRDEMLERNEKISKKVQIDSILFNKNARQNFINNVEKGIIPNLIPEYNKCIGKQIEDTDYEGTMDEIIPNKIQNIVDIQELARFFKIPISNLTKREKNLLKWVTIIESIDKSDPESKSLEQITKKLGFVKEDIELIKKLIQDKFKDENDILEARDLIYGDTGIGPENIVLYIAKKFIDSTVMRREVRDQRMDELRTYAETMKETKELNDLILKKSNIFKNRNFQNLGLKDTKAIIEAKFEVAKYLKANPRTSYQEILKYMQVVVNETLVNIQEEVAPGVFVNSDEAKLIKEHTITLDNGKKMTIFNEPIKFQNTAFKMGIDYYGQIINHPSGDGVTAYFLAKKGLPFPKAFDEYAKDFRDKNIEKFGNKSVVYKTFTEKKSVSCFYVSAIGNQSAKIPDVDEKEFEKQVIMLFNEKEKSPIKLEGTDNQAR